MLYARLPIVFESGGEGRLDFGRKSILNFEKQPFYIKTHIHFIIASSKFIFI
jgi:hypothetical protein